MSTTAVDQDTFLNSFKVTEYGRSARHAHGAISRVTGIRYKECRKLVGADRDRWWIVDPHRCSDQQLKQFLVDAAALNMWIEARSLLDERLKKLGSQPAPKPTESIMTGADEPDEPDEPDHEPAPPTQEPKPTEKLVESLDTDEASTKLRLIQEMFAPKLNPEAVAQIVRSEVAAVLAKIDRPKKIEIQISKAEPKTVPPPGGLHHKQVEEVLRKIKQQAKNILMVGPAGSGKTTIAESVAKHLDLPFNYMSLSEGTSEAHIMGRVLPQESGAWLYQISAFVRSYTQPGVWLFDEIDAVNPNVLMAINSALANGHLSNPVNGEIYNRHEQFIVLCAGNTYGTGASSMYTARNQIDGATLDRFGGAIHRVYVDYDEKLEQAIMEQIGLTAGHQEQVTNWLYPLRKKIIAHRLIRLAGARTLVAAAHALANGGNMTEVTASYFMGWPDAEIKKVQ